MPKRRTSTPEDPVGNYCFTVEIDGLTAGYFANVDGLSVENEMIEWASGEEGIVRKRPGLVKYGDVTLKKGYVVNDELEKWLEDTRTWWGKSSELYARKTVSIILLDNAQAEVVRWNLSECYPKSWKVTGFDAKGTDVVFEELVLWCEWFDKA